ncbi:MAG TPA: biotin--[acetyl-CoA-carboxylase] ligase [Syntrophales bacterium]|nr:biotin--[acetyl-CoA-carboxylase] ligase [Syntrophales bacterium]
MEFNEQTLADRISKKRIGNNIQFFKEVESTNDIAFQLAKSGAPEGTVVIADCQTKGKGRLKRQWQSPPGCNIYTSVVLRPAINPVFAPQITLMAGVAVADVLSGYCPENVTLKWPNDVQIRGRKVCGVLTEMSASASKGVDFIIIGIGINVNIERVDFDESFRDIATSLKEEAGSEISRLDLTVKLFDNLEYLYTRMLVEGFGFIKDMWLHYFDMVGRRIQVVFNDNVQAGEVLGVDDFGALIIADENDVIRRVMAGDASVVKE